MKKKTFLFFIPIMICLIFSGSTLSAQNSSKLLLKNTIDSISYCIGTEIAKDFKSKGIEINTDALTRGFMDVNSAKQEFLVPEQEKIRLLTTFQQDLQKKQKDGLKQKLESNQKEGAAFLEENAAIDEILKLFGACV